MDLRASAVNAVSGLYQQAVMKDIRLAVEGEEGAVHVWGEEASIGILLRNLRDNAIRYTSAGGEVSVRLERGTNELRVRDSGPGIPVGERDRVFQRGEHQEVQGSGLDLSIVQQAARCSDQPG